MVWPILGFDVTWTKPAGQRRCLSFARGPQTRLLASVVKNAFSGIPPNTDTRGRKTHPPPDSEERFSVSGFPHTTRYAQFAAHDTIPRRVPAGAEPVFAQDLAESRLEKNWRFGMEVLVRKMGEE
jgi:hypothetical protein